MSHEQRAADKFLYEALARAPFSEKIAGPHETAAAVGRDSRGIEE